jgi:hypothetical protein
LSDLIVTDAEKQNLCVEIFALTGHKVDVDDPLVVAALFYTTRLRTAGEQNKAAVNAMLSEVEGRLQEIVNAAVERMEASAKRNSLAVVSELRDRLLEKQQDARASVPSKTACVPDAKAAPAEPESPGRAIRITVGAFLFIAAAAFLAGTLWGRTERGLENGRARSAQAAADKLPQKLTQGEQK